MAYIKTAWNETIAITATKLNNIETQYDEAKTELDVITTELSTKMPIAGGTFTGKAIAQSNTDYTVRQVHNMILSTADANISLMSDGDIWLKYKV